MGQYLVVDLHDAALFQLAPLLSLDQFRGVLDDRVQEDSLHAAVEPNYDDAASFKY